MSNINQLLRESTTSTSSIAGRPNLVALTRATTKLVYMDLVAEQRTTQPVAALYGIKYLNPNKDLSFVTGATYGGAIGPKQHESTEIIDMTNKDSFVKGDLFKYQDVIFKVLKDTPFAGTVETDIFSVVLEAVADSSIRMVPDAADTSKFESADSDIAEASFQISKWQAPVKSRKLKTELTVELAQDLEANGFDASNMIEDVLATQMAEEINKDILQGLITVSSRFKVEGVSDKGVLDLTTTDSAPEQGRRLYRFICEMNSSIQRGTSYSGTYVVASSRCAAVLAASGWMGPGEDAESDNAYGVLNNGLPLFCDTNSPIDYVIVGVKAEFGDTEAVGSLFYAPYTEGLDLEDPEHVGVFKAIVDPESLQPKIALLTRYALCVNPYTTGATDEQARIIDASDFDLFAGRSQMSTLLGVKLPKLIAG
ncbi:phage capsid vertex [Yersinia phage phiR1-RT]|uniref:Capsid vertex protein n=1 Tax=Yersinia phage phiR1-RT TaxID=1206558 RepID=I7LEN5_BPPR1|nr:phage capsid vertex [Yersinia phage phiR1-RT]CCI88752.1 phage capsid vertex [Yersinia phage phiR1-RT]